jgi:hypothetical protein
MIPQFKQVLAAATDNPSAVAELIDWPVSGAARLVRSASGLDPADRRELVARGVAELLTGGGEGSAQLLGAEVAYLNERPELTAASTAQDEEIRAALRLGPLPEGIADTDREVLAQLAVQSESIAHTAILRFAGNRAWGLAVGAFERVAVVRRQTDG